MLYCQQTSYQIQYKFCVVLCFTDQIQNDFILLESENSALDCFRNLFEHCSPRHLSDHFHIHHNFLEICEKVPGPAKGQDQKDY